MGSVTMAVSPTRRSVFIRSGFFAHFFRAAGHANASSAAETTRNTASCTPSPAPRIAAISAHTAPPMNQTDTSVTVAASATMKTTMAISHPITA